MKKKLLILTTLLCLPMLLKAAKDNSELIDYSNIKEILKADQLDDVVKAKKKKEKAKKEKVRKKKMGRYLYPSKNELIGLLNEYWLVKNAAQLSWNYKKPDYGLDSAFKAFLEKVGLLGVKFKILLIKNSKISHFALPYDGETYTFLLSSQFIRSLDLSRQEISLLLLEDLLRAKEDYFKNYIWSKKLQEIAGKNFYGKKFDKTILTKALSKYDQFVFNEGFSFKQQFFITKKVDTILKSDLNVWGEYLKLIEKIDSLIKSNILFQDYAKIYPSPELQLNWLRPKKSKL